ncbi:GFA family protein [Celerinatantimonas sp. YJH-8]|uniref:GFA family protein n=1 Tax=Celerinatantimonas sp. YJH-8 TaxID=3228714 RepID=UPI0038CAF7A3
MSDRYKGSCLCGQVRFEAAEFKEHIAHCHCSMCRKFHGATFGTLAQVKSLTWLSGQEILKDYVAPNGTIRTFCSHCGSSIGFRSKNNSFDQMELALGLFDDNLPVSMDAHIYTEYKANWVQINDDLVQYPEGRE